MRNVILIAVVAAMLLIAGAGQAQELGGLTGSVVDTETGEPLAFVNVSVRGTVSGGISGRDGKFYIQNIMAGTHEVAVSMMGYETVIRTVTIRPDRTVEIDFELKESVIAMGEVVVTATRTPRYLKDVPIRTEVVTRQSFKDAGACDIYEALEGVAGVRVEQQCQFCNFSQVRMQGLGPDHTQILVDGQPVYSGLASVYGLQQTGTSSIERIEVVKGAGSALHGSGAIAGAINLVTRVPSARPEAGIGIEFGEHESRRYDFSASQRFGNVGLVLFAQKNSGGVIDETGDGIGRESVYEPDRISDRVRTDLTSGGFNAIVSDVLGMDQFVIRGRALHELRQGGELYNNDYDVPEDVYENPFTPGTERIVTDRHEIDVSVKKQFESGNDVGVSFSYAHHDRNATNDTFITDYESVNGELAPIDLLRPYLASEDIYAANINYSHPVGGKHRLLLGGQLAHNRLEESGMYVVVEEEDENYGEAYRSTSEKHSTDVGLYIQDEFAPSKALEFVLGVRYDKHDSEDKFRGSGSVAPQGVPTVEYSESSVSPRAAVRFSPTPGLALRASVGTGFRVPYGFSEDLHLCSGSPRVWKGGNLMPEKSVSYSVSADYYATRYNIGVSLYRTDVRGKIG
ncbi:TonB-dependent receptor, partial [bacterium]|nr:TonB-dependent receptor [bacterium]